MITNDTICAVSTAPGIGGIAVIRISGKDAVLITERIYKPVRKERLLTDQKPYTLSYGNIIDEKGMIIDEVMVARFVAPHSFTGEDTIEISCHGSLYIQQQIIALLIRNGCRSALPGEFTQRKNGSFSGRSGSRPYRFNVSICTSPGIESDAGRL